MGESTRLSLTHSEIEVDEWIRNGGCQPPHSQATWELRRLTPGA
jgi:hypothetical protein